MYIPEWFVGGPWDGKSVKEMLPVYGSMYWTPYAPICVEVPETIAEVMSTPVQSLSKYGYYNRRQIYIGSRVFTIRLWSEDPDLTASLIADKILDRLLAPFQPQAGYDLPPVKRVTETP